MKAKWYRFFFGIICITLQGSSVPHDIQWGFFAHRLVAEHATYTLPAGMRPFYKRHLMFLRRHATKPDERRYAIPGESPRHYIDLDVLAAGDVMHLPVVWDSAQARLGAQALQRHGRLPWHILYELRRLEEAFFRRDAAAILRISAELSHYVSDAHVPLHTTSNYNGQFTGQWGVHGLWEQRLPELYHTRYNLFLQAARYHQRPSEAVWGALAASYAQVAPLLEAERQASIEVGEDRKYSFEKRGTAVVRTYCRQFVAAFNARVGDQVIERLKASCQLVGDFWFTAWVNAGQPDLDSLSLPLESLPEEYQLLMQPDTLTLDSNRIDLHLNERE